MKLDESAPCCIAVMIVAFTPKGGCPLKPCRPLRQNGRRTHVAFTPKGGCPLKPPDEPIYKFVHNLRSIHPQGWVPIETDEYRETLGDAREL